MIITISGGSTIFQNNKNFIVFIHGVGLTSAMWKPQINFFKEYNTLTYDLLGHGKTPLKRGKLGIDDFSEQLFKLIKEYIWKNKSVYITLLINVSSPFILSIVNISKGSFRNNFYNNLVILTRNKLLYKDFNNQDTFSDIISNSNKNLDCRMVNSGYWDEHKVEETSDEVTEPTVSRSSTAPVYFLTNDLPGPDRFFADFPSEIDVNGSTSSRSAYFVLDSDFNSCECLN